MTWQDSLNLNFIAPDCDEEYGEEIEKLTNTSHIKSKPAEFAECKRIVTLEGGSEAL